jgi:hypothetical protein
MTAFYEGRLELEPEQSRDLLRVLGESGARLSDRLGLPPDVSRTELVHRARSGLASWASLDALGAVDGPTRLAVSVGRRAYERVVVEAAES